MSNLIGPLTAAEWAEFRLREDDDLLSCCGITSDFRTAVFDLLRNADTVYHFRTGAVMPAAVSEFRVAYWDMVDHELPGGRGTELIDRLAHYYLGDPPAPATDHDRTHIDQVIAQLCRRTGQPTVTSRPTRFAICALPEGHKDYRHLRIDVELRRVDPDAGDRWAVRWGSYIRVFNPDFTNSTWEVDASDDSDEPVDQWQLRREFGIAFATQLAHDLAVQVEVGGRTAADIIARDQARAQEAAAS